MSGSEISLLRGKSWIQKLETASGKKVEAVPTARHLGRTVYLLLDCSGSMEGEKLEAAGKGALAFASEAVAKDYQVGLIAFASTPGCYREARAGIAGFAECLAKLEAAGSTDLAAAIVLAMEKIARCPGGKVFCVVTDGIPDDADAALAAAKEATRHGIEIMAIGTDDADRTFLDRLVTRCELAAKVERRQLGSGIASMAGLLPGGGKS